MEGAELVGPLPAELDQVTKFAVAVLSTADAPDVARAWIAFLRGAEAQAVIKAKGLTPVP